MKDTFEHFSAPINILRQPNLIEKRRMRDARYIAKLAKYAAPAIVEVKLCDQDTDPADYPKMKPPYDQDTDPTQYPIDQNIRWDNEESAIIPTTNIPFLGSQNVEEVALVVAEAERQLSNSELLRTITQDYFVSI